MFNNINYKKKPIHLNKSIWTKSKERDKYINISNSVQLFVVKLFRLITNLSFWEKNQHTIKNAFCVNNCRIQIHSYSLNLWQCLILWTLNTLPLYKKLGCFDLLRKTHIHTHIHFLALKCKEKTRICDSTIGFFFYERLKSCITQICSDVHIPS